MSTMINPDESLYELKKKPTNFDAKKAAYWNKGDRVPFLFMAKALDEISKVSDEIILLQESDLIPITEILCNMVRTVIETTPEDLLAFVYLLANRIAPAHTNIDLGLSTSQITLAFDQFLKSKPMDLDFDFEVGVNLGNIADSSRREHPPLTVDKVFETFHLIAKESGDCVYYKKMDHIKSLLVAATSCEPECLILLLKKKLPGSLVHQTLLTALGHAAVYSMKQTSPPADVVNPLEEAADIVKQVYSVFPVYDKIVPALLSGGLWSLTKTLSLTPGIPCTPMNPIQTIRSASEIFDKFQDREFTCEYAYDGKRAMIHYMENDGYGQVEIYSEEGSRITDRFLDVRDAIFRLKRPSVSSFILDCQIVRYDRQQRRILQIGEQGMGRKEFCIYAFDILYLNGQQLLQEQLKVRREHLYQSFFVEPGYLQFATTLTSNDPEEILKFLNNAVNSGSPGLIIKTLTKDSTYEPVKRCDENWLILSRGHMDSIPPRLYLVPIAALKDRNGVCIILACFDSFEKKFHPMCAIEVQVLDKVLQECFARLQSTIIPGPMINYSYPEKMHADLWFEPTEVWEVKGDCLVLGRFPKGIMVLSPRLVCVLGDKNLDQASSPDMVAGMFKAQEAARRAYYS